MPFKKYHYYILGAALLLTFQSTSAQVSLACTSKIGGSWNFGTAPSACNVSPLMSGQSVQKQYLPVLFDDARDVTSERKDFLSEMYSLLREVGTAYLIRVNPQISDAEVKGFLDGLYALAHQETFWTHYRVGKDQLVRYMRGDSDHGHGMMQVDDRSHVAALREGRGVDLVYNIMYGLDVYYAGWLKAASASCVSSATNYKNRARAAWSAYNGGPGKVCRWSSSPTSGDTGYLQKFNQRSWLNYVRDTAASVRVDVNCLMYNTRPCALPGSGSPTPAPAPAPAPVPQPQKHLLIGKTIIINTSNGTNLRDLQTNTVLIAVPRGTKLIVEDVLQKDSDIKTYLKVTYSGRTGTIYAGHQKPTNTQDSWIKIDSSIRATSVTSLAAARPYQLLRECADYSCAKTNVAVKGGDTPDTLQVLQKQGESWVKVQVLGSSYSGWLERSDLKEISQ